MQQDVFFTNYNPTLFQTEAWRKAWLSIWSDELSTTTTIGQTGSLEGYFCRVKIKNTLPIVRVTPMGNPSELIKSIRSEYFQLQDTRNNGLVEYLSRIKHEAIFPDVVTDSETYNRVHLVCKQKGFMLVEKNPATAYSVDSTGEWSDYTKRLGSNTRLKLVNRRKRLAEHGEVSVTNLYPDIDGFIAQLNWFHETRWGKACYSGKNLAFIKQLLSRLEQEGHGVELSALTVNGEVQSLLLDIRIGGRVYNLQGGFHEDKYKGVSLGTLHFGYQIEKAFSDEGVIAYDFMAGEGKNSNYKERFANQSCELISLVIAKPFWLKLLHKLN